MMKERFLLAYERLLQIETEQVVGEPFASYFKHTAKYLCKLCECYTEIEKGTYFQNPTEKLAKDNAFFYAEQKAGAYEHSYLSPDFAKEVLGEAYGPVLSFLSAQCMSVIPALFEGNLFELVIHLELFLEIYTSFMTAYDVSLKEPKADEVLETIYFFVFDYLEEETAQRVTQKLCPKENLAYQIICNSDLSDPRYLYAYGHYISENQIKTAQYLAKASKEQIQLMADTYTEGYRMGFVKGNKDLSQKKVVQILYPIGFERMIRASIENFEKMGLQPVLVSSSLSVFHKRGLSNNGYYATCPNKQFLYDHKEDEALFLDKKLVNRKLEVQKAAHEANKEIARKMAGPAVVEVFGETPFQPSVSKAAVKMTDWQQELSTWYYGQLGQMTNAYIPGEERSFTIIAFPIPEIGPDYEEIMDATIALNTLDYQTYENIQQAIIDALDRAEYVRIKGRGDNRTDLKVMLTTLDDPTRQTKFENCVADVNIPVGEVFTSPVLKGTNGVLHVSRVFLNELEYKDLSMTFTDGMITDYSCGNFEQKQQGRRMIRDQVLYHHESLPIGEFAIGTNTMAYVMGRKYKIEDRLPILIAEKTGPHFAVGDTCYSHAEDVAVYNPDGKEIVARDNEISLLRKTDVQKAYFQCHTDITIPYDELGSLYGVTKEGKEIWIIRDGRFVLEQAKKLNEAFI